MNSLASYPNLYYLEHPEHPVTAQVSPAYTSTPAPMGITDFGLGTSPYSYSTPHFLGEVTFNTPPNVTQPGAEGVLAPGAEHNGLVGSDYEFGIQLNTVLTNVSIPNTDDGIFWTQNVVNVNDTGIHFVDDIFNLSVGSDAYIPHTSPATILSGCGLPNVVSILSVYGGVYQCVGQTVPISAANYPITIRLYNNVTVNSFEQDVMTFGYDITGTGLSAAGISDTVIFNNPNYYYSPTHPVGFTVSGTTVAPVIPLLEDAELDLVGGIGGDNAVFHSLSGSMQLEFSNASSGGWTSVPSAYDFGTDTGETSIGFAGYWTGTTEQFNQGPSMLYGLWKAVPHVSVASGGIRFQGSIDPSYGFVFVGNLAPDPVGSNFSYLPTNVSGGFDTYLPPAVPPATQYYVQAFAPEYQELNGTPFSAATVGYTLTLTAARGTLNAPLYMNGNAQAAALATAVTGSSATPYTFKNLVVNSNFTFNHLNGFGYPSFEIFSAIGVTAGLTVSNVYQGFDSRMNNFYFYDTYAGPPPPAGIGLIYPPPEILPVSLENYTGEIMIFDGSSTTVTDETLIGSSYVSADEGSSIFLWADVGVTAQDLTVEPGPYGYSEAGVDAAGSSGTQVSDMTVLDGEDGVSDIGSIGTHVTNVTATDATAVYALTSSKGSYSWINSTVFSDGVYAGYDGDGYGYYAIPGISDAAISHLNASEYSTAVELWTSQSNAISQVSAYFEGEALFQGEFTNATTLTGTTVNVDSFGAFIDYDSSSGSSVSGMTVNSDSLGVGVLYSSGIAVGTTTVTNDSEGVVIEDGSGVTATGLSASYHAVDLVAEESTGISFLDSTGTNQAIGAELFETTSATVSGVSVSNLAVAVLAEVTENTAISGIQATNTTLTPLYGVFAQQLFGWPYAAIISYDNAALTATNVTATNYGAALYDEDSSGISLGLINATSGDYAVVFNGTVNSLITGLSAYKDWQGVVMQGDYDYAEYNTVTASQFVDDTSYGVALYYDTEDNLVWNNDFIGNNGATTTYSAAHIQAYSEEPYNTFYYCTNYETCTSGVGNYWADWHTYGSNGYLAPYAVTGGVFDEFPIGPQETFTVTFTETGLSSGTNWSVTFNGVTHSSTTSTITFESTMGTYSYTVNGVQGYQLNSGPTGSVTLTGAPASVAVVFTSTAPLATQSTVNSFFSVALIIAIIALVLALLALLWRRGGEKKPEPTTGAPTPWTPPSGATTGPTSGEATGGAGAGPSSGSGATWSEGSSSGSGSPPPSS